MKTLDKNVWLCYHLYGKLELIEKEPAEGFSNNEKHFIKALAILYGVDEKHANYFAKKYRELLDVKDGISGVYS